MFKLIAASWFSILSVLAYILITIYMKSSDAIEIKDAILFGIFTFPWGYTFGSKIRADKTRSLNGFTYSVYIGFLVTILSALTFTVYVGALNAIDLPIGEALLGSFGFLIGMLLVSGILIFPIGVLGAIIFWSCIFFYENYLTKACT